MAPTTMKPKQGRSVKKKPKRRIGDFVWVKVGKTLHAAHVVVPIEQAEKNTQNDEDSTSSSNEEEIEVKFASNSRIEWVPLKSVQFQELGRLRRRSSMETAPASTKSPPPPAKKAKKTSKTPNKTGGATEKATSSTKTDPKLSSTKSTAPAPITITRFKKSEGTASTAKTIEKKKTGGHARTGNGEASSTKETNSNIEEISPLLKTGEDAKTGNGEASSNNEAKSKIEGTSLYLYNAAMAQKSQSTSLEEPVAKIKTLSPFDVLFEQSKFCQESVGNLNYSDFISSYQERYENASKNEKTSIADEVVQAVKESSGRFLKEQDSYFVEVSDAMARDKVSISFGSLRKQTFKKRMESQCRLTTSCETATNPSSLATTSTSPPLGDKKAMTAIPKKKVEEKMIIAAKIWTQTLCTTSSTMTTSKYAVGTVVYRLIRDGPCKGKIIEYDDKEKVYKIQYDNGNTEKMRKKDLMRCCGAIRPTLESSKKQTQTQTGSTQAIEATVEEHAKMKSAGSRDQSSPPTKMQKVNDFDDSDDSISDDENDGSLLGSIFRKAKLKARSHGLGATSPLSGTNLKSPPTTSTTKIRTQENERTMVPALNDIRSRETRVSRKRVLRVHGDDQSQNERAKKMAKRDQPPSAARPDPLSMIDRVARRTVAKLMEPVDRALMSLGFSIDKRHGKKFYYPDPNPNSRSFNTVTKLVEFLRSDEKWKNHEVIKNVIAKFVDAIEKETQRITAFENRKSPSPTKANVPNKASHGFRLAAPTNSLLPKNDHVSHDLKQKSNVPNPILTEAALQPPLQIFGPNNMDASSSTDNMIFEPKQRPRSPKNRSASERPVPAQDVFANERRKEYEATIPRLASDQIDEILTGVWKAAPRHVKKRYQDDEARRWNSFLEDRAAQTRSLSNVDHVETAAIKGVHVDGSKQEKVTAAVAQVNMEQGIRMKNPQEKQQQRARNVPKQPEKDPNTINSQPRQQWQPVSIPQQSVVAPGTLNSAHQPQKHSWITFPTPGIDCAFFPGAAAMPALPTMAASNSHPSAVTQTTQLHHIGTSAGKNFSIPVGSAIKPSSNIVSHAVNPTMVMQMLMMIQQKQSFNNGISLGHISGSSRMAARESMKSIVQSAIFNEVLILQQLQQNQSLHNGTPAEKAYGIPSGANVPTSANSFQESAMVAELLHRQRLPQTSNKGMLSGNLAALESGGVSSAETSCAFRSPATNSQLNPTQRQIQTIDANSPAVNNASSTSL